MMRVENQVCWVSGAAQGIGFELCKLLVGLGGKVAMVDVCDPARGEKIARQVADSGPGKTTFIHGDLTTSGVIRDSFEKTKQVFGAYPTIVVNNAGIVVKDDSPNMKKMMDLNATAVIEGTNIAADLLRKDGRKGCIINTASMAGLTPVPDTPAYAASKWAVVGFTCSMGSMLETHGVRVNCICPIIVETPAVGKFFKDEFKNHSNKALQSMAKHVLDPLTVAQAFMQIIHDDKLHAQAVGVALKKTYVHSLDFRRALKQQMDPKVPEYVPRSKI